MFAPTKIRVAFGLALTFLLISCATGDEIGTLREGMTKDQVIAILGQPDGFQRAGDTEQMLYTNRLMSGWSWDRADYGVILTDGHVTAYGPGVVREHSPPVGTLIVPTLR